MNVLQRLQERVFQKELEGSITNKEQLQLFATGYLQGVFDQYNEDYFKMTNTDRQEIKAWVDNYYAEQFYFTFGSDKDFPFQNGYIVVKAKNVREAARKFKAKYPNTKDASVLNCSDYYCEEAWKMVLEDGFYVGQEPYEVME